MCDEFDIFYGTWEDPFWLEMTEGLTDAISRMKQRAQKKPGRYFVYKTNSQTVVASINTHCHDLNQHGDQKAE